MLLSTTGAQASTLGYLNPLRYRGYVYDEETGLYYLRSRYYNPTWERFVNADILISQTGRLLSSNQFSYCDNSPVAVSDLSGQISDDCTHVFFKDTFYVSGEVFWGYMKWQFERHPKKAPPPPVVEALDSAFKETIVTKVVDCLGKLGKAFGVLHDYGSGFFAPFFNKNYKNEDYIVDLMTRCCSSPGGYKAVKIEFLHGSHSAEVRMTILDQHNNLIQCDPIVTQGYNVILDMITSFESIINESGGFHTHEGVEWMYSLGK